MKKLISSLLFLLLISACTTPVTLEFEQYEPEVSVNCLFTVTRYFNVNVTYSKIKTDTADFKHVDNATVTIKAIKANVVHELFYHGNGDYCDTTFYPQFGEAYRLSVQVPGFEPMTATDSLPSLPIVTNIRSLLTDQPSSEGAKGYKTTQHYITIAENGEENNYFELWASAFDYSGNRFYMETLTSDDPVITNEQANEYFKGTLIFSDELFNGDTITLFCEQARWPGVDDKWIGRMRVIALSEKYYRFSRMYRLHRAGSYDIVYPVEPVIMESGIENAYGIFAGYTATDFIYNPTNQPLPE